MNDYQQLANSMGVSLQDLMLFANLAVNSLEKDRVDIAKLYAREAAKKHEEFLFSYLKKEGAKEAFMLEVYTLLKA